jgi:outer membrane protein OmpA-like peptidoglycan-associated protein
MIVAALTLTGCGGGAKRKTVRSKPPATRTTRSSTTSPARLPGVVSFDYYDDQGLFGADLWRVTIYDLRRNGPFVTLDFGAHCLDRQTCSGGAFFVGSDPLDTPRGISLIDTTNNLEYLPVTDSQSRTYASQNPGGYPSLPERLYWVTFPAPPASVTSLDVAFSNGGPQVPDVPITTAATGPTPSQVGPNVTAATPGRFAEPPNSTSTSGLTLRVLKLVLGVGNPTASDAESPGHSKLTLSSDVLFHFDKSNLTPAARSILDTVAARIKSSATGTISVTGYTDSIGTNAVNIPLSQARARSVINFVEPLTAGANITYTSQGLGPADPVAPNTKPNGADNPAGRSLNRRVTISYAVRAPVKPAPIAPAAPSSAPSSGSASRSATFTAETIGNSQYQLTAGSLFRDGDMVVLRFTARCLNPPSSGCDGILNLSGTTSIPPSPGYQNSLGVTYRTVSGAYLQDASGTDYIPVYDQPGTNPVAAETNQEIGSSPFSLWAYYPAPPQSVTSMSVVLPGGSAKIADVPISASAPTLP